VALGEGRFWSVIVIRTVAFLFCWVRGVIWNIVRQRYSFLRHAQLCIVAFQGIWLRRRLSEDTGSDRRYTTASPLSVFFFRFAATFPPNVAALNFIGFSSCYDLLVKCGSPDLERLNTSASSKLSEDLWNDDMLFTRQVPSSGKAAEPTALERSICCWLPAFTKIMLCTVSLRCSNSGVL